MRQKEKAAHGDGASGVLLAGVNKAEVSSNPSIQQGNAELDESEDR